MARIIHVYNIYRTTYGEEAIICKPYNRSMSVDRIRSAIRPTANSPHHAYQSTRLSSNSVILSTDKSRFTAEKETILNAKLQRFVLMDQKDISTFDVFRDLAFTHCFLTTVSLSGQSS
jgi:hypothetical protein